MPHISSDGYDLFHLLNGAMSPNPFVAASLQVGDNGTPTDSRFSPEFTILSQRDKAHGRLIWDPDHRRNGTASPFFTVAPVRFQLKPHECLLSVGTGDYLRTTTAPFRRIERIQIGAISGTHLPSRTITWDFLEIDFTDANGRTETHRSNCLPRVSSTPPLRRSVQADDRPREHPQQFTEISARSREIVEIKIRGQVTLRANDQSADARYPLLAEDLQGRIQVFTDSDADTASAH
jgi:hypothetical protein